MKKSSTLLIILLIGLNTIAQTRFYSTIKVEFEKNINVPVLYRDLEEDDSWYEMIKDRLPKNYITYYEFIGDSSHSIYKPGREAQQDPRSFYRPVADKNVVYNDYRNGTTVSLKPVYEETFLMQDSLLSIKWKLTPDTRTIAGFDCRKAIGIIGDTLAVFAFYTDELMVTGGPEGIHGLPGMILGLGIPRLHTTWFATKVEVANVNMGEAIPAKKGKKVNRKEMLQAINDVLKNWGTYGSKLSINFVI
jgi:GLPGLI family protein